MYPRTEMVVFGGIVPVALWYLTNGLNSIHVKMYMKQVVAYTSNATQDNDDDASSVPWLGWMGVSLVTTLQLFAGTGLAWLALAQLPNNQNNHATMMKLVLRKDEYAMGMQGQHIVHAAGSFFTSLGFFYGSATLVQIIKLLEPVQTLLLAEYLVPLVLRFLATPRDKKQQKQKNPRLGTNLTWGVALSTFLIVGSSMSLLLTTSSNKNSSSSSSSSKSNSTQLASIVASLASGFTLSLRNILVKKNMDMDASKNNNTDSGNSGNSSTPKSTNTSTTADTASWIPRKKLLSFANLSYLSGLCNLIVLGMFLGAHVLWYSIGSVALFSSSSSPNSMLTDWAALMAPMSWDTILYHPCYNFLSILVLSLMAVLSHALLNVGKRISSIILSVLYFREQAMTPNFFGGLLMAAVGGIWHIYEMGQLKKQQQRQQPSSKTTSSSSSSSNIGSLLPLLQNSTSSRGTKNKLLKPLVTGLGLIIFVLYLVNTMSQASLYYDASWSLYDMPGQEKFMSAEKRFSVFSAEEIPSERAMLGLLTGNTPRQVYGRDRFDACQVVFRDPRMSTCHLGAFGGNFGDMLGPDIVKRLLEYHTGCSAQDLPVTDFEQFDESNKIVTDPDVLGPCLWTVGSVMRFVRRNDHVWGTGSLGKNLEFTSGPCQGYRDKFNNVTVYSVRGPRTVELMESLCPKRIQVYLKDEKRAIRDEWKGEIRPCGDGGFLIPFLFPEVGRLRKTPLAPNQKKKFDSCLILHHYDKESVEKVEETRQTVLPVIQPWRTMAGNMSECAVLSSSSLHGLILADAYGIPARWIQANTAVLPYKFSDYYESMGADDNGLSANNKTGVSLELLIQGKADIPDPIPFRRRVEYAQKITASFPYHLFETVPIGTTVASTLEM